MKTKITLLIALFITMVSFAQNGINYKAVVKDANGNLIANKSISILASLEINSVVTYSEEHTISTDNNGVAIIIIGAGNVQTGDYDSINWKVEPLDLNIQVDVGDGYVDMGNTEFRAVPYAITTLKPDGLENIDEGNGIGWRLASRNAAFYGNIGENAVDLSFSNSGLILKGALGLNSFATGFFTTASGDYATSMGYNTEASGNYSTSLGFNTETLGDYSMASGDNSSASGDYATAFGYFSNASGDNAIAMGRNINADSYAATSIGRYNLGGGNATFWNTNDPLFEIGNGTSTSDRQNALTVFKNGHHYINSDAIGLSVEAEGYGISINNSGDDAIRIVSPGDNGIYIDSPTNNGLYINNAGNYGANIEGEVSGLAVRSTTSSNPDIILRGNSSANVSDDGIITSDPAYSSSDIYIRSNDAVVIELDDDNNEPGSLIVRNGDDENVFTVDENGAVNMGSTIQMTFSTIVDYLGEFVFDGGLYPDIDNQYQLGSPSFRWESVYSTNGTISTSDRREKKNIKQLDYGLAEVLKMQPVSFNWKNKNNSDTKLGLIAQDLQVLIPEVVKSHTWEKDEASGTLIKKELDRLGVYYSDLVPVLINAIKEQQQIIQNHGKALKESETNYKALLSRIETLESNSSN